MSLTDIMFEKCTKNKRYSDEMKPHILHLCNILICHEIKIEEIKYTDDVINYFPYNRRIALLRALNFLRPELHTRMYHRHNKKRKLMQKRRQQEKMSMDRVKLSLFL